MLRSIEWRKMLLPVFSHERTFCAITKRPQHNESTQPLDEKLKNITPKLHFKMYEQLSFDGNCWRGSKFPDNANNEIQY